MDKSLVALGIMFGLILVLGLVVSVSAEDCLQVGQSTGAPMPNNPDMNKSCCAGLTRVSDCYSLGSGHGCELMAGCGSVCVNQGDGVCGAGENVCNSPKDCDLSAANNSNNCTVEEDCYPIGFVYSACGTFYSCISGKCIVGSNACVNNTKPNETRCRNLYWIDKDNNNCEQKQFCGMYMYYGLQTFEEKEKCFKAVGKGCIEKDGNCCKGEICATTSFMLDKNKNCTPVFDKCNENCIPVFKCKSEKYDNKFTPWQKRNESECPEGCKCRGAVVSCKTEDGKNMTITAGNSGKTIEIEVNKIKINTNLSFETETNNETNRTKLIMNLPDGRNVTLKIMPERAAEKVMEKLGNLNFTIQLREVTVTKGDQTRIFYFFEGEKHGKFLGLFKMNGKVLSEVDSETGEIIKIKNPWWAFLASGI